MRSNDGTPNDGTPVDEAGDAPGSLTGLRVVDLTTNVAGPFATQILGDLGADVIKVERSGGDDTRGWGPPFWEEPRESVSFSTLNRNKRSVVLDLRTQEGRDGLDALVAGADVLVQNMRPGSFERLGYSWERLRELNGRLVYCDLSGFGHSGPRRDEPAYDPLMQAFSGLMSLTGEDGRAPARIPVSLLDKGTGMWASIAVLDALRTRDRSGRGAHLQLSLLETALSWEPAQLLGYVASGRVPGRLGSATPGIAPYQAFPTSDGYVVVAAGNQRLWERLCATLDRADLLADERYVDNAARVRNLAELSDDLTKTLQTEPTHVWVQRLSGAGVPVAPIQTVDEVVNDEQVVATGAIERLRRPDGEHEYGVVRLPIHVDGRRHPVRRLPPRLGEHTAEVLGELARTDDRTRGDHRPSEPAVQYRVDGRVAYVTINRPERRNAFDPPTRAALIEAFAQVNADPEVWAMVLTGAGDRAFCAGADLKYFDDQARSGEQYRATPMEGADRNVFEVLLEVYKPTVAALNGAAVAGGCELALACDVRIASDHVVMGLPEAKRGMGANFASVVLPRLVPRGIAFDMLYTGRYLNADEALRWGLVNQVVPGAELDSAVHDYAAGIVANAPLTLRRYKEMMVKGWDLTVPSALRLNVGPNPYLSEDREEGARAFVEKRQPRWRGR